MNIIINRALELDNIHQLLEPLPVEGVEKKYLLFFTLSFIILFLLVSSNRHGV